MFFFLAYFTLYNRLQFHPSHSNWFKFILFNGWVILHCVYVPQLSYPFICWWTSRLLPCPGCCKQCCSEHWGTRVSFNSSFLGVYAQQWDYWVIWQLFFQFFCFVFVYCLPPCISKLHENRDFVHRQWSGICDPYKLILLFFSHQLRSDSFTTP